MRKLAEILKDYKTTKEAADKNLDEVPRKVYAGWAMRKAEAQQRLPAVKKEFAAALQAAMAAVVLVLAPNKSKRFLEQLKTLEIPVVVQAADELYVKLAEPATRSLEIKQTVDGEKVSMHAMFSLLQLEAAYAAIRVEADRLDYSVSYPVSDAPAALNGESKQAIVTAAAAHLRTLLRQVNGDTFSVEFLRDAILEKALKEEWAGDIVPVILTGVEAVEAEGLACLFGLGTLVINEAPARDKINKEYVRVQLEKLREVARAKGKGPVETGETNEKQ